MLRYEGTCHFEFHNQKFKVFRENSKNIELNIELINCPRKGFELWAVASPRNIVFFEIQIDIFFLEGGIRVNPLIVNNPL